MKYAKIVLEAMNVGDSELLNKIKNLSKKFLFFASFTEDFYVMLETILENK